MPHLRNNAVLKPVQTKFPEHVGNSLTTGLTEKSIFCDQDGSFYLAKKPDVLTVSDVFQGYLPQQSIHEDSPQLQKHIYSVQLERSFLEVLIPLMAKNLFKGVLEVPDNYLHITEDKTILVISKFIDNFQEFLGKKECIKGRSTYVDFEELPSRKDLQLTADEARIIGQLYAVALLFNLWDLFNSKLLNSGYVVNRGQPAKACIVDFGYGAHISYKGRHTDTLAYDDPNFILGHKIEHTFFGKSYQEHYRHDNALPFDTQVGPLLPHAVVTDLYSMSGKDEISQAMLSGFKQALKIAEKNEDENPQLLEEALSQSFAAITLDSKYQQQELKAHLHHEYYKETLIEIVRGRLRSALELIPKFEAGEDSRKIHEEIRDNYYLSQLILK